MQGTELAAPKTDIRSPLKPGATASITLVDPPAGSLLQAQKQRLPRLMTPLAKTSGGAQTSEEHQAAQAGPVAPVDRAEGEEAVADKRFLPFSLGPRQCLGRSLAHVMHDAAVARIMAGFRLELAPRMGGPAGVEAACINRLTLQSGTGMWMRFHQR